MYKQIHEFLNFILLFYCQQASVHDIDTGVHVFL